MRIFNSLDEIGEIGETAAALGNFDGIHKGHQALIDEAVRQRRQTVLRARSSLFPIIRETCWQEIMW